MPGAMSLANFSDDESDEDGEGHGTHVAGTIGSRNQHCHSLSG
jgi:subtilisin family serine protease